MGLFSRLFGAQSQEDRSYVRMWAEKRRRELRYSDDLSIENLFAVMMYSLSCFCEKDTAEVVPSEMKELGFDTSDRYSGDAALFELGCYMYVRLDLWLYKHKPDQREAVSTTFVKEFIKLFSQALNSTDIPSLFSQRVTQYGKLVRTGADPEEYHRHLSQLILRTRDNKLPQSYDFESIKEPLELDADDEFWVKTALIAWEENMLPASLRNVEKYCELTESQAAGRKNFHREDKEIFQRCWWLVFKTYETVKSVFPLTAPDTWLTKGKGIQPNKRIFIELMAYTISFVMDKLAAEIEESVGREKPGGYDLTIPYQVGIASAFKEVFGAPQDDCSSSELIEAYWGPDYDDDYDKFWSVPEIELTEEDVKKTLGEYIRDARAGNEADYNVHKYCTFRIDKIVRITDREKILDNIKHTYSNIGLSYYENAFFGLSEEKILSELRGARSQG